MAKRTSTLLPAVAVVVVAVAVIVGVRTKSAATATSAGEKITATVSESDVSFSTKNLGATVRYIDYEVGGQPMQLLAVKDGAGKTHVTLNTCQNCNGSPRAFFVQNGSQVTCQNCGISHNIAQLGAQKLGCNPIPVRYDEDKASVSIARADLDRFAPLFRNWKKGL